MGRSQKRKGARWERESCKLLNEEFPDVWKRIPMSGAIGTIANMPLLKADIVGDYEHLSKKIVGENKYGYGGKQMTLKKEWFDHIQEIAEENYAIPAVVLKFERARSGIKHVICLSFETWTELMSEMADMYNELMDVYEDRRRLRNELQRATSE